MNMEISRKLVEAAMDKSRGIGWEREGHHQVDILRSEVTLLRREMGKLRAEAMDAGYAQGVENTEARAARRIDELEAQLRTVTAQTQVDLTGFRDWVKELGGMDSPKHSTNASMLIAMLEVSVRRYEEAHCKWVDAQKVANMFESQLNILQRPADDPEMRDLASFFRNPERCRQNYLEAWGNGARVWKILLVAQQKLTARSVDYHRTVAERDQAQARGEEQAEKERLRGDIFRAVLEGMEFENIDALLNKDVATGLALGKQAMRMAKGLDELCSFWKDKTHEGEARAERAERDLRSVDNAVSYEKGMRGEAERRLEESKEERRLAQEIIKRQGFTQRLGECIECGLLGGTVDPRRGDKHNRRCATGKYLDMIAEAI